MGYVFGGVRGYVNLVRICTNYRQCILYVRVFGGVRGYVIVGQPKTVVPTLVKKRGPAENDQEGPDWSSERQNPDGGRWRSLPFVLT